MIHAGYELARAMRGFAPIQQATPPWPDAVCGAELHANDAVTHAFGWMQSRPVPTTIEADCPACLRLLAAARGRERTAELLVYADHLEGVVAAHTQAISDLPTCDCGGPMVSVRRAAAQLDLRLGVGMKHRVLKESHALFCERCYHGRHDSERAVRAAELPEDLESAAYAAAAKLVTIRAANLFTPGESAARRKTA